MIRLHIIAEGQTEEEFVKSILTEHLGNYKISTDVHRITTNPKFKKRGGSVSYEKIEKDIKLWLKQDQKPDARFTTMVDLYALPNDFPDFNQARKTSDPYQKVKQLEEALGKEINDPRFIPYIQLHEFEALILSDPSKFKSQFPEYENEVQKLLEICEKFDSPELIDDGVATAPSKRIIELIPVYKGSKPSAGSLISNKIGLQKIREKCPHFNQWITKLEGLTQSDRW